MSKYQHLADKYAPSDPEIANILAKLQLPPDLQVSPLDRAGFVPLPSRRSINSKQQIAIAIRDGRQAARRLKDIGGLSTGSTASGRSLSGASSNMKLSARRTSLSTVLEQDFTVPGKKSSLLCPYTRAKMAATNSQDVAIQESNRPLTPPDATNLLSYNTSDPVCAVLNNVTSPPPSANGSATKCPIRYLDQQTPEEVAKYFEIHKHEIPRSHEVCVKRYQKNDEDIRKLDAKYGNLVSMIQGLGQKHQAMLPPKPEGEDGEGEGEEMDEDEDLNGERISNERVESWAHAVSTDGIAHDESAEVNAPELDDEDNREGRFDRPLKEIRVGESPSRPWGISVPILDPPVQERTASPIPSPFSGEQEHAPKPIGRCPFGHDGQMKTDDMPMHHPTPAKETSSPAAKCPFGNMSNAAKKAPVPEVQAAFVSQDQPAFLQPPEVKQVLGGSIPQMVFTGPVFIGYPMEQALAFMQQYKGTQ
jgi:hypothetical protein